MNTRKSLYDIKSFYNKKAVMKSSFKGMRYQVEQAAGADEEKMLRATVWPEPFSFEKTAEERKTVREFSYDEEGLDQVYDWLCKEYESRVDEWTEAMEHPFREITFVPGK